MGDISKHFDRKEFECHCGCGFDTVDIALVALCETVRDLNGNVSLSPNCGCRCPTHNSSPKINGSKKSQHMIGRAADLPVKNPKQIYEYLCAMYPNAYGFGLYSWGIHVDTRSDGPARWKG